MSEAPASRRHLVDVVLEEGVRIRRKPEVEHERAVAIFDLIEDNHFIPVGDYRGPYILHIGLAENRLVFDIHDESDTPLGKITLSTSSFRSLMKDYFTVCESYFDAIKRLTPSRIEAIDMGRRALHDEGSHLLQELLAGKVEIDEPTSRRLFTLLCVLHMRG